MTEKEVNIKLSADLIALS